VGPELVCAFTHPTNHVCIVFPRLMRVSSSCTAEDRLDRAVLGRGFE
jgi:hypothetical protein